MALGYRQVNNKGMKEEEGYGEFPRGQQVTGNLFVTPGLMEDYTLLHTRSRSTKKLPTL